VTPIPKGALLVEKNLSGHRLNYVRLVAGSALELGLEVFLMLPAGAKSHPNFELQIAPLLNAVHVEETVNFSLENIEQLSRSLSVQVVVVTDGDSAARQIARGRVWRGDATLSLLIMRERDQSVRLGLQLAKTLVRGLALRFVSYRKNVNVTVLKPSSWAGRSWLDTVNDPIEVAATESSIAQLERDWGLRNDLRWIAVVGVISERKNLPMIAEAIASIGEHSIGFLIAGTCEPAEMEKSARAIEMAQSKGVQVVVRNELLSDAQLDSAIALAECVVLAHSNEGPSGILGKALLLGTKVVASGARSLRRDARDAKELIRWSPLSVEAIAEALSHMLSEPQPVAVGVVKPASAFGYKLLLQRQTDR
jgi:glycosyltransferase involved in cell wall biosynthesis